MKDLKEYILQNINKSDSVKRQIFDYLLAIHDFKSFEDFKDVISTMIEVEQFQHYYNDKIIELIISAYSNPKFNSSNISSFIKDYLTEGIILGEKYSFYYSIYQSYKNDSSFHFPVSENELKEICFKRLHKFVELKINDLSKCSNLYYLCRDHVDSENRVVLQDRAHPVMRKFINNFPWEYIQSLIRPYGTPLHRKAWPTFTLEPFIENTFNGWDNFWLFLDEFKKNNTSDLAKITRFDKYYLFFIRFKNIGYKPIQIPENEWPDYAIDKLIEEQGWLVV